LHHTHWARDLALAAGASDADAVESSFASDRRSREFYLLKLARGTSTGPITTSSSSSLLTTKRDVNNTNRVGAVSFNNPQHHLVPQFMQPVFQAAANNKSGTGSSNANSNNKALLLHQRLDANTAAQIRFRRSTSSSGRTLPGSVSSLSSTATSSTTTTTTKGTTTSIPPVSSGTSENITMDSLNVKTGARLLQQMNQAKAVATAAANCASIEEGDPAIENEQQQQQQSVVVVENEDEVVEVGDITSEPLNDPTPTQSSVDDQGSTKQQQSSVHQQQLQPNLAQKAAGFIPSDSANNKTEKVNMAAVLSGMGVQ
jgi:hypothetical protein